MLPTTQFPTILLIDDELEILSMLERLLHALVPTHDVLAVSTASAALTALVLHNVPLVITDYRMPGVNGILLAESIKHIAPETCVAIITAHGAPEVEHRAHAVGADYYLHKPIGRVELAQIVRESLG
jgi:CheY-like chemotaxis protein